MSFTSCRAVQNVGWSARVPNLQDVSAWEVHHLLAISVKMSIGSLCHVFADTALGLLVREMRVADSIAGMPMMLRMLYYKVPSSIDILRLYFSIVQSC